MEEAYSDRLQDMLTWEVRKHDTLMRLHRYVALTATTLVDPSNGDRETTYRINRLDVAAHRLVPVLLGCSQGGCDHEVCELMTLNALAADYAQLQDWEQGHKAERAAQLGLALLD